MPVIDSALEKVAVNKIKDINVHLIFSYYDTPWSMEEVLEKMKKFRINHVMVTWMFMIKKHLITKETRDRYYLGLGERITRLGERIDFKESINDSIETLLEDIRLGHQPNEILHLYFTPRLTEEEMQLIERKDPDYLRTFSSRNPDVNKASMKNSESDSKFCYTYCQRETKSYQLPNHENSQSQTDRIPVAPPVLKKIKFN